MKKILEFLSTSKIFSERKYSTPSPDCSVFLMYTLSVDVSTKELFRTNLWSKEPSY